MIGFRREAKRGQIVKTGIGQRTWVIVETLNRGEDSEKVTVRRIPLSNPVNSHNVLVDEAHLMDGERPEHLPFSPNER